ncbi:hypothetical protein LX36DRAFT_27514 [Colletotrichum falcatum]|nr:hypothetical protein LX36DRAFT_27514 [Colletotrichum falcatum]
MNGYHRESAGDYPPPPGNEPAVNYYYPPENEPAVNYYFPPRNDVAVPNQDQVQELRFLPPPNSCPRRTFAPFMSAVEPRLSGSGDAIHLPLLRDTPAPQLSRTEWPLTPVKELIRDVDEHFGQPWSQRALGRVPDLQRPGSCHPYGGDAGCFGRLEGSVSFVEKVLLHRSEKPGKMYRRGDGTVMYVSETITGQFVAYRNAGPPTFQWDEVREAWHGWDDYAWAGHSGYAVHPGYGEQANEQAEAPGDGEWSSSLSEIESDYLLHEQWQQQNPPPGPQDDNQNNL